MLDTPLNSGQPLRRGHEGGTTDDPPWPRSNRRALGRGSGTRPPGRLLAPSQQPRPEGAMDALEEGLESFDESSLDRD